MKKKQLLEAITALEIEYSALLAGASASPNPVEALVAVDGKEAELKLFKAELAAIETLEAKAKANIKTTAPATAHDNKEDKPWKNSIEFFAAVIGAGKVAMSGGDIDPRLHRLASGANESIGSEGGFLVETDTSAELLKKAYTVGALASKCRQIPISTNANGTKINGVDETSRVTGSRYGGLQSYWAAEAQTVTSSFPKFRKIELNLKKLFALVYATEEQLADGPQLKQFVDEAVPAEIAFMLDAAIFSGTGAGQPLGVLTSAAFASVAKEVGQAAATVVTSNIAKMFGRMWAGSMANAEWFINQDVFQQLPQMSISNQPIFTPPGGFSTSPFGTLLGRPINMVEQASTLGTQGDIGLLDLSQYALAIKGGVNAQSSMHVRFLFDEQVFKFTMRVDGQPMWASALTPFKGTATQSPFIFLDTRA